MGTPIRDNRYRRSALNVPPFEIFLELAAPQSALA